MDGIGSNAQFNDLGGMIVSADGSTIFVVEYTEGVIRKINCIDGFQLINGICQEINEIHYAENMIVIPFAGNGLEDDSDGIGVFAGFDENFGLCFHPNNNIIYVMDFDSNIVRHVEISTCSVTSVFQG